MADLEPDLDDPLDEAMSMVIAKPSMLAKVNVLLILMALVGVQCLAAYFIIPSREEVALSLNVQLPPVDETDGDGGADAVASEKQVEVELGEFSVAQYQPITETQIRIDFTLWGTVNGDVEGEDGDRDEFEKIYESKKNRFRDEVNTIVRAAELKELRAAELGLIRRKILEKSNRIFGKPYLKAILFTDYGFYEQ